MNILINTDNETYATGTPGQTVSVTRMPLVLCGYRYYNPQVGRFLTRDPEGSEGGINLYAYCRNNPVNCIDSLGTQDNTNVWNRLAQFGTGFLKGIINSFGGQKDFILPIIVLDPNYYNTPNPPMFPAGDSAAEQAGATAGTIVGVAGSLLTPGGEKEQG